jgi:hypothetical protein
VNATNNNANALSATYYDATRVYQQIASYTKDTSWNRCAVAAERQYRDMYVIPNAGKIPGYWIFTAGLTHDFLSTGDTTSRDAVNLLSSNAAYAPDATPIEWLQGWEYSRETALNIMSYLDSETLGSPRRARLASLVNTSLGHIDQWFVSKRARYVKSFMVGLTCLALIDYHSVTRDPRVVPAVRTALDGLWELNWSETGRAFKYTDVQNPGDDPAVPAPDLNQIIAPAYEWLYRQTNEERFRTRGDKIFAGGVDLGFVAGEKQFNQLYRWSFDFVRLRSLP